MKIGMMNYPPLNPLDEIAWAGEHGFGFIDFTFEPPSNRNMSVPKIRELLTKYNLDIVGHTNPTLPAIYPIAQIKDACIEELKHAVNFFSALGAKKVNIHPFYYSIHQEDEQKVADNISVLSQMCDYCHDLNINLMLENFIAPFDNPEIFAEILKQVPGLKIHLDVGHCNIGADANELVSEFFNDFGDKIIHLHVHDNNGVVDEHLPLGAGDINWPNMVKIIKSSGFDSTITLEVFAKDRDYLLISKEKLLRWWKTA